MKKTQIIIVRGHQGYELLVDKQRAIIPETEDLIYFIETLPLRPGRHSVLLGAGMDKLDERYSGRFNKAISELDLSQNPY